MKTAISLPDAVFEAADQVAQHLGISRSELYARAVAAFVAEHNDEDLTAQLNQVYAAEDSTVDTVVMQLQILSLPQKEW